MTGVLRIVRSGDSVRVITVCTAVLALGACSDPFAPSAVRHFAQIDAGTTHVCAVAESGEPFCWGANDRGQLGNGSHAGTERPGPVDTDVLFQKVTAGDGHSCGLSVDGVAYCWGWNPYNQRGDADAFWDLNPIPVETNLRFTDIDAGWHHTCAIAEDATVHCWGSGRFGQLGNGLTPEASNVVQVLDDVHAVAISAGAYHTCAVTESAQALCWGSNDLSQLGTGLDDVIIPVPTPVAGSVTWRDVAAGVEHSCGIATDGRPLCWGSDAYGELGNRTRYVVGLPGAETPVPVVFPFEVVDIAAGLYTSCLVDVGGTAYCWGRGTEGQLGIGGSAHQSVPQTIHMQPGRQMTSDRFNFTQVALSSAAFTCGLADGSAFCWGTGPHGELGARGSRFASLPQRVRH